MLRIQDKEERAADSQNTREMVGAHVVRAGGISVDGTDILVQLHQPLIGIDPNSPLVKYAQKMIACTPEQHAEKHRRIDNFAPLAEACATYEEMKTDTDEQAVPEEMDHEYATATFTGIHEAVARKCGGVPVGCFRCEQPQPRYIAGAVWIRHETDRHYLVFMDASGNTTEYRIWFCPFCGKKF